MKLDTDPDQPDILDPFPGMHHKVEVIKSIDIIEQNMWNDQTENRLKFGNKSRSIYTQKQNDSILSICKKLKSLCV